jgi:hypothetical protein
MLINRRNALMTGKRLPYDAEVEFLESTGTQWIDTGVLYDTGNSYLVEAICQFSTTPSGDYNYIAGWGAGGAFGGGPNGWTDGQNGNNGGGVSTSVTNISMIINEGVSGSTVTTFTPGKAVTRNPHSYLPNHTNGGFPLFGAYIPDLKLLGNVRFYAAKFYINNVLVRDFIPVRKGTVGYLYDRVSGKLFGNAGTGDFVLGPDVVPVEWLDNGGTAYINTEYIFKTKPRVVTNCMINNGVDRDLFGTSTVDASCFIFNPALNSGGVWLYYRYGSTSPLYAAASKPSVGQKMHIDASDKVYIDDALILTRTGTYDFSQNSTSCRIFSARNVLSARIYDFSMWDGDALVRKYYPVRVGTEGAMMDVLTRRIYRNAGTGAFTYGDDLPHPI